MIWIFALGLIVLAVVSPGFRKLALLIGASAAVVFAVWMLSMSTPQGPPQTERPCVTMAQANAPDFVAQPDDHVCAP